MVKNLLAMQEIQVCSLACEYPLEKGMATHSSILAWRIPRRSLAGYNPRGHKESDMAGRIIVLILKSTKLAESYRATA